MEAPVTNTAIMLVEDDPNLLNLLGRIIGSLSTDYTILAFERADVALTQILRQPTALVITDYHMPGMNGLQLTAAVKARAPGTRIVLLSADVSPDLRRRALDRGVDYMIPKPFQIERMIQIVQAALA